MIKTDWSQWQRRVILEEYMEHISPQIKCKDNEQNIFKKNDQQKQKIKPI